MVDKETGEEPSSQVKGIWDSVVSWMKMAADYIALDGTIESLPNSVPHGKVCVLSLSMHSISDGFFLELNLVLFINIIIMIQWNLASLIISLTCIIRPSLYCCHVPLYIYYWWTSVCFNGMATQMYTCPAIVY